MDPIIYPKELEVGAAIERVQDQYVSISIPRETYEQFNRIAARLGGDAVKMIRVTLENTAWDWQQILRNGGQS